MAVRGQEYRMVIDWSSEDDRYAKGNSCTHRLTTNEEAQPAVIVVLPSLRAPQ